MTHARKSADRDQLKRSISLPILVLYGLGTTIGAGIYVLVGAAAGYAGLYTPIAFILAALVIAPTAGSFAELSARFPVSAGEAAYVEHGFGVAFLSLLVGVGVAGAGIISSAALVQGAVGYLGIFIDIDQRVVVLAIVVALGAVAAWGITQSMLVAAAFTLFDLAGLALVIVSGLVTIDAPGAAVAAVFALPTDIDALWGIAFAALLGFFAFIGFEDIVNVAEETRAPERTLPAAIILTLVITTALYVAVATVAVIVVPSAELAASSAPLALVVERAQFGSSELVSAIAVGATVNGVLIQIVMSTRVIYGLGRLGRLPPVLARVNQTTRTPLIATGLVVILVATLALTVPLVRLAEVTSTIILLVFALVNAALIMVKRGEPEFSGTTVPRLVPWTGLGLTLAMLAVQAARLAGAWFD